MSRVSSTRQSNDTTHRILQGKARLGDFLSQSEIARAMVAAEWRIIRIFAVVPPVPGRVSRIGDNLANVVSYVDHVMVEESRNAIYSARNLPTRLRSLSTNAQEFVVRYILRQIFVRVISRLIANGELQCLEGEWLMSHATLKRGRHSRRIDDSVCRRG